MKTCSFLPKQKQQTLSIKVQLSSLLTAFIKHLIHSHSHTHSESLLKTVGTGGDQLKGHLEAIILIVVTGFISVWLTDAGVVKLDYAIGFPHAR